MNIIPFHRNFSEAVESVLYYYKFNHGSGHPAPHATVQDIRPSARKRNASSDGIRATLCCRRCNRCVMCGHGEIMMIFKAFILYLPPGVGAIHDADDEV